MCSSCRQFAASQHPSFFLFDGEMDAIKIEKAREVLKHLSLSHWKGPRIFLFNEAHVMTAQASNALLKAIEEPPPETYFFLITSQLNAILPTIRSRCQMVRFGPLSEQEIHHITGASGWVLKSAAGSVERATQLKDPDLAKLRQLAVEALGEILKERSHVDWMEKYSEVIKERASLTFLLETWQQVLRDLSLEGKSGKIHEDLSQQVQSWLEQPFEVKDQVFQLLSKLKTDLDSNVDRQLLMESGFLKIKNSIQSQGDFLNVSLD
ncbi:MAG: hypothetical protein KDD34_07075 [Bdellovibrionales bacterium]|nr:hypothetical protein [Bdellovibrionales bacterium]